MIDPWYALADPTRRRVYGRVVAGPCSVTEIARELPVSRPAVSQHLKVLLDSGLVDVRRQGRERLYRPRPGGLSELRQELEAYWVQTLTTFKSLAEQSYRGSTAPSDITPAEEAPDDEHSPEHRTGGHALTDLSHETGNGGRRG